MKLKLSKTKRSQSITIWTYAFWIFSSLIFSFDSGAQQSRDQHPQFIAISFDGSKSISMWERTREMARASGARITYFVSGVYMLTNDRRNLYREPQRGAGRSAIGWGGNASEMNSRIQQMIQAHTEGHEISSHGNGHFDGGSKWSDQQWISEFEQFHDFLYRIFHNNGLAASAELQTRWAQIMHKSIVGYRAPLLETNAAMYRTLARTNWDLPGRTHQRIYHYDASKVASSSYWPEINTQGIYNFPLASLRIVGSQRRTLSMDYNFYVAHSNAKPQPENAARFEKEMFDTYMAWFRENYNGRRAPMSIGHHFSLWNGGAYFSALNRFAQTVCKQPEVICGTYGELVQLLNTRQGRVGSHSETQIDAPQVLDSAVDGFQASSFRDAQKLYDLNELQTLFPNEPALYGDHPDAHRE